MHPQRLTGASWIPRHVTVTNLTTGEAFEDVANVVITARGQLNEVSMPDTPGLRDFKGKVMHSAEWDDE
jgi:cation diffusion facilitator CzcD-associated flavoprotein CzcO